MYSSPGYPQTYLGERKPLYRACAESLLWERDVVEAVSSSYDWKNLNPERPERRDPGVLRTAKVDPFHIPSDPRMTQNGFAPFIVGPSVNDKLGYWRRIGHVSTTIRRRDGVVPSGLPWVAIVLLVQGHKVGILRAAGEPNGVCCT
jgi:hypothetical protein